MTKKKVWIRPRSKCPTCKRTPALGLSPGMASALEFLVEQGAPEDEEVLSFRCRGCGEIFALTLGSVAGEPSAQ